MRRTVKKKENGNSVRVKQKGNEKNVRAKKKEIKNLLRVPR